MKDAINLHECPIVPLTESRSYCGRSATHTILIEGSGAVDVCWGHAKLNDEGKRLTIYTGEPVAAASNG